VFTKYFYAVNRPKEVIVFIIGGATYEEFSCIETELNNGGKTIIIGGTNIVNSKGYVLQFLYYLLCGSYQLLFVCASNNNKTTDSSMTWRKFTQTVDQ